MTEYLKGKRTYVTLALAVLLLVGQWAGYYTLPAEIYGVCIALALWFLRSAIPPGSQAAAIAALASYFMTGCASVNQTVRSETHQTNGIVEIKVTSSRILAIGDAKQSLEKLKASNGKTQSIGLDSAQSETTSESVDAFARLIGQAARTAAGLPTTTTK